MKKIPKQEYTTEFKEQAVKQVRMGKSIVLVAKELGLVEQTLRNWVKLAEAGKLNGKGTKAVTPEQMDLSRLRAENVRLKRECEILKKATGDSTGHCNTTEIFCDGDKKFNVFLGRSFNSSAIMSSCSCE
ncbi:MAG: transposase [Bacteroidia bacterium]|jgi:transposase|nr:transposase [Bacteroidia bacterium]PXW83672.1 transposase-like protein [Nitrosomonas sp. Nm84]TVM03435.1 MAG: hypothetical protein CV087_05275 [Candidatus Brocadia sp. WS118]